MATTAGPWHLPHPTHKSPAEAVASASDTDSLQPELSVCKLPNTVFKSDSARREADEELLACLRREGCEGPGWQRFAEVLAEYGFQVIRVWTLTSQIHFQCRKKGIGSGLGPTGRWPWTVDDADEVAAETVAIALQKFRESVIMPGRWSPNGGASLKTFFIGQALLQFPNVYRRWLRENRQTRLLVSLDDAIAIADSGVHSDPADIAITKLEADRVLALAKSDRTRTVLKLRADGYSNSEIAEMLEVTEKAVEAIVYRHRRLVRSIDTAPLARGDRGS